MIVSGKYTQQSELIQDFKALYYVDKDSAPSGRTIRRMFKKRSFVRLVLERRHMLRDVHKRVVFLRDMQHVPVPDRVDLDEMASSPDQFLEGKGWGMKGKRCIKIQIKIGTKHYSVIAAYGLLGFICWSIIEGSYGGDDFTEFLTKLTPYLTARNFGLVDNSTTQKNPDALLKLNATFRGLYRFSAEYSPDLKLIEKGFSYIKRRIRHHEDDALLDPIGTINKAFSHAAIGMCTSTMHHFQF
jgi:DDE superfamily endonuclease